MVTLSKLWLPKNGNFRIADSPKIPTRYPLCVPCVVRCLDYPKIPTRYPLYDPSKCMVDGGSGDTSAMRAIVAAAVMLMWLDSIMP